MWSFWHSAYSTRTKTFTNFQGILNLVSVLNDAEEITQYILKYIWAIMSQNNDVQVIQMTH